MERTWIGLIKFWKHHTSISKREIQVMEELTPGGVNSPVRAFKSVGGQPIIMDSVMGCRMRDIDGNEYIDYVGSWGPAIIGHADDESRQNPFLPVSASKLTMSVLAALAETMKKGTSFGAPCLLENVLAEMVISAVPSIEMVRFVNSGTEACMGEVAALILEPVVGNSGFIAPKPDFLNALHNITKENDAFLIFDKVMTGFRLSYGGAQEYFSITPDLTTIAKIIGGGFPVGAYGGRREIMEMVAPAGPMYQAGTLGGNPLAMTAGIQTLKRLKEPGSYDNLNKITSELILGILDAGKKAGHAIRGGYVSGMFGFFFNEVPVYNFGDAKKSDTSKFASFYRGMLEEGVYFAPSQFEAGFTSLTHTFEDIQQTIAAAEKVFRQL
ncbi:unnamed protein product [Ilex paraguariensis]|uniref:Glutamate-1-semialdehyde 2,1-aminomutase n=1 Tax=Ilex paraguariensis TaxID=185542 RepID=A0ABC8UR85_9AQUA